jgi:alpha-glucoside transport system permease protein
MSSRREAIRGYLFILPAVVLLALFLVYPTVWTVLLSFDTGRGLSFSEFVGLENYKNLFTHDRLFLDVSTFPPSGAVINNLRWVVVNTTSCVGLGLLIATLAGRVRYASVIKSIVFLPMALSGAAVAVIWLFVYSPDPNIGLLNALLTSLSSDASPVAFTGRSDTVNWALIGANVWAQTGFAAVVFSAALNGLPSDVLDAARVDGAGEVAVFVRVTLPMLRMTIATVAVTLIIWVLKIFDIIYIMTQGGPRGASRVMAYTMYVETFQGGKAGYGAAVATLLLVLTIPVMAMNIRRFRAERASR